MRNCVTSGDSGLAIRGIEAYHSGMNSTFLPVAEQDIREALRAHLVRTARAGAVVRDEMNAGDARVDLARIGHQLEGFEIKSDADTLGRLARQIAEYGLLFDTVTLVAGVTLFQEAAERVPEWWGLIRATCDRGSAVTLTEVRRPMPNPGQSVDALTRLLWRDEAALALSELSGLKAAKSASAKALRSKVARNVPLHMVKPWVLSKVVNPTRLADWQTTLGALRRPPLQGGMHPG